MRNLAAIRLSLGSMRVLLGFLSALSVACACIPASAQSFHLRDGDLFASGTRVGTAVGTRVARAGPALTPSGRDSRRAALRIEGAALSLAVEIDLTTAHLLAGIGRDTRLVGGAFATTMLRGTWAPVLEVLDSGVRIGLPPGAPRPDAMLPSGAPGVAAGPEGSPWSSRPSLRRDDATLRCELFTVLPERGAGAPWLVPDTTNRARIHRSGGWDTIAIDLQGFRFIGYRRSDAPCVPSAEMIGLSGFGTGAGDGWGEGRVVVLPAGTELYATETEATPFGTLRVEAYGIEDVHGVAAGCDASGACVRYPPLPTGTTAWIIPVDDPSGAQFLLHAWVRTPAETLADAPPGHGSFGLVTSEPHDWPTP